MLDEQALQPLVRAVAKKFPSFGGGRDDNMNPIAHALREYPRTFAAGVSIEEVVRFVIEHGTEIIRGEFEG